MLISVKAINPQGESILMTLGSDTDSYFVKDIVGLGPVKATLVFTAFAKYDGAQYQSSRREPRNMVLTLGLNPDFAIGELTSSLRMQLYSYFMPKNVVEVQFVDSELGEVGIMGRVETFEPNLFTSEPEVVISVMCFDPDFYDTDTEIVAGNTTSGTTMTNLPYLGTVETGMLFTLNANRTMTGFTIYHEGPDNSSGSLEYLGAISSGQQIIISTVRGRKYANVKQSGAESSRLYAVSPYSDWIQFQPGLNKFRVQASGAAVPFTIAYNNKYGGL